MIRNVIKKSHGDYSMKSETLAVFFSLVFFRRFLLALLLLLPLLPTPADAVPARSSCGGIFPPYCDAGLACTIGECRHVPARTGEVCGALDPCDSNNYCEGQRCKAKKPAKSSCAFTNQCQAGLLCTAGECRHNPGQLGEICGILDPCGSNLSCVNDRCAAPRQAGQSCGGSNGACASGLACTIGECRHIPAQTGEVCGVFDPCDSNNYCEDQRCKVKKDAKGSCSFTDQCKAGLLCTAGECRHDPGQLGETCGILDPCSSNLSCVNNRCAPPRQAGESCGGFNGACASGLACTIGECRHIPAQTGEVCGILDPCDSSNYCEEQRCKVKKPAKSSCVFADQCQAGLLCTAGECRHVPARLDETCGILDPCTTDLVCNLARCSLPRAEGQSCEGIGQGTCQNYLVCGFFSGTCEVPVCGGEGEPICQSTPEGEKLCDPGFHPDFGFCVTDTKIAEPDCDCDPEYPVGDPSKPVRGYADLHLHLFSNLAFGGLTVWGDAFDKNLGISGALRADNYAQRTADHVINGHVKQGLNGDVVPIDLFRAQQLVHGDLHINDIVGFGTGQNNPLPVPSPSLANGGVEWADSDGPHFVGWPRWNSTTHQQAYYTWLQRAHRGGLQLAVMMAVNNEAMCISGRYMDYPQFACDDGMKGVDLQIAKAIELEEWLNQQCASAKSMGSNTNIERSCATATPTDSLGWFKVVLSPAEAREAIARGQLAVVIGIEEANVFDMAKSNCASNDLQCNIDYLETQLDKYYDKGVRHVFPIHNFDNPYGAAATWMNTIAVGNRYVNSTWFATENCPVTPGEVTGVEGSGAGYGFKLAPGVSDWLAGLILGVVGPFLDTPSYYPGLTTSCNSLGLTDLGKEMITMMMKKGMIIDVDHMSIKSFDSTIELAQEGEYAGVVASHALMYDLTKREYRHERMRTAEQLREIAALGGMIGAMTQPPEGAGNGVGVPVTILQKPGSSVYNDCQASSKTFAHAYEWAVEVMTVDGKKTPVAFGTDFNGISRHNAPRFGIDACDGQLSSNLSQNSRVKYPFDIPGFGAFRKQDTGGRKFDYNEDGLAHVGMLPDMIEDLKKVGLTDDDLEPLFESAEAYIAMWENSLKVGCDLDEEHGGIGQPICEAPVSTACDTGLVLNLSGDSCEEPPPLTGDFNVDDCIDRSDLDRLLADVNDGNSANDDPIHDLDGDGQSTVLDTHELELLYTNPRGTACGPRLTRESAGNFGEKQLR